MEIKLNKIHGYVAAANRLAAERIPLKTAYKLAKLKKELEGQLDFYDETYRKIIMECAELDSEGRPVSKDDGTTIQIKPDKIKEVNQRMGELNELTAEIKDYQFGIDEFGDIEIDADTLGALMDFIGDEE